MSLSIYIEPVVGMKTKTVNVAAASAAARHRRRRARQLAHAAVRRDSAPRLRFIKSSLIIL